jgi:dolichol kinase
MPTDGEKKRKALHFSSSWVPIVYYLIPEHVGKAALLAAAAVFLALDVLRLNVPRVSEAFNRVFGEMVRKHESSTLLGSTSMVISALLAVYCFEKNVAVAAMLFLTVGDSMAGLMGTRYGKTHIFGKTLEGSLACFAVCVLVVTIMPGIPFAAGIAGAFVATLVEVLPIPLDDNFRIPLSAGFMIQLLMPS